MIARNYNYNWYKPFQFFTYTYIPFLKASKGLKKFILLSDSFGNINLSFNDISFFSSKLDETFLTWNIPFYINFIINYKKVKFHSILIKHIFFNFFFFKGCWK